VGSAHPRIVFPVKVSVSRIGQAQRGTWAFAEQDVQVPRTERRALSAAAKAFWANKSRDTGRAYLGALGKIVLRFKEVARRSEYYLKLYSPERQRIVQTLLASGVPVEQPIEVYPKYSLRTPNTRSGTPPRYRLRRIPYSRTVALFAREDYENLVTADKIDTASVCAQIRGICTGMHNAGVAHNDADLWNFVVNPRGHVKVVDLGKSRRYLQPPRTQAEFIKRGLIPVDSNYRTNVPSIYAAGDVIGSPALASTSMEQGRLATSHAFGLDTMSLGKFFPYGIYTIPEISMVGPTEEELRAKKADFVVGRAEYREVARGQIVGDRWGLLKLLVDRKTQKILGVHIIGEAASNLIHIGQAVMALNGDVNYFIQTVFNYPTLAEAYKTAAFQASNQIRGVGKAGKKKS
jgi:hypothetical protein